MTKEGKAFVFLLLACLAAGAASAATLGSSGAQQAAALRQNRSLAASHDKAVTLIALGYLGQRLAESLPEQRDALIRTAHRTFDDANALAEALDDIRTKAYATGIWARSM